MEPEETVPASVAAAGPAFRNAYVVLRRQYATQLPQKLQDAQAALQACLNEPQESAPLDQLRRLMHTMAGTAPTLGFEAHGAQARRTEQLVQALSARPQRTAADFAEVEAAVAALSALEPSR